MRGTARRRVARRRRPHEPGPRVRAAGARCAAPLAFALVVSGSSACGLPHDGDVTVVDIAPPSAAPTSSRTTPPTTSPRTPPDSAPSGPTSSAQGPSAAAQPAPFFLSPAGCLAAGAAPVFASADTSSRAEALLVALAAGPDDARRPEGWATRVTVGQRLSVGAAEGRTLELVVPPADDGPPRDEWWTAQLVHTAVSLPGISTVRFVDPGGRLVRVPVRAARQDSSEVRVGMVAPRCP